MRRRIWCELLPPEVLAEDSTLALLQRFALEPIVALPPERETEAMFAALRKLTDRKIRLGIWPLLSDAEGYWPSLQNAELFAARVRILMRQLDSEGIEVSVVAFDLEPPLEVMKNLIKGRGRELSKALFAGLKSLTKKGELAGAAAIAQLERELSSHGIETLAAVMPNLVLDLASRSLLWEHTFRTPLAVAEWSVVSPMLYTTLIKEYLPSKKIESARALLYESTRLLVQSVGPARASVSLGLVSTGKLGDEPFFVSPHELLLDVAAARAGGAEDLALFSLEGVLLRGEPEAWLMPFTAAEAQAPTGLQARVVSSLVRGAAWASTPLGWIR
jgi:hypothetical protein